MSSGRRPEGATIPPASSANVTNSQSAVGNDSGHHALPRATFHFGTTRLTNRHTDLRMAAPLSPGPATHVSTHVSARVRPHLPRFADGPSTVAGAPRPRSRARAHVPGQRRVAAVLISGPTEVGALPPASPESSGDPRLLTVEGVARRLQVGESTVYALCKRGEVPHVSIQRSIRIPADELARWLQVRRRG
jgi:excisionase family DNA binding protein